MRPPPKSAITAVILAGGQGRRLGCRDKAWINWRGRPLVAHVVAALQPQVGTILIASNRGHTRLKPYARRVIRDQAPTGSGPLGGWHAALKASRTPWILSCPIDDARPNRGLAVGLARGLRKRPGAYAQSASGPHYLHALLQRRLRGSLQEFRAAGGRAAGNWLSAVDCTAVEFADARLIWSLNNPADLRRLRRSR